MVRIRSKIFGTLYIKTLDIFLSYGEYIDLKKGLINDEILYLKYKKLIEIELVKED